MGIVVIAAANSSARSKERADFICDGDADEVQIRAAIDCGLILFAPGDYYLNGPIHGR